MIVTLRGVVLFKDLDCIDLEVNGIGYCVFVNNKTLSKIDIGKEVLLYVYEHIREDAYKLYGFLTKEELSLFKMMLNVSGVGPKVSLAICESGNVKDLYSRVENSDVDWFSTLPGLGKKTAQKIILELKGKIVEFTGDRKEDTEVVDALIALGYSASQAKEAVKNLPSDIVNSQEKIKLALQYFSK